MSRDMKAILEDIKRRLEACKPVIVDALGRLHVTGEISNTDSAEESQRDTGTPEQWPQVSSEELKGRLYDTIVVGFCPRCQQEITHIIGEQLFSDVSAVTNIGTCFKCNYQMPKYLQASRSHGYAHTYMSTYPTLKPSKRPIDYSKLLFFVASEAYIWLRGDNYNGFARFNSIKDIPPVKDISPQLEVMRADFPPDILFFICSSIASGVIGNIAYSILKNRILAIWNGIIKARSENYRIIVRVNDEKIHINVMSQEEMEIAIKSIYDYCEHRLQGIGGLDCSKEPLSTAISFLKSKSEWSSKELAQKSHCSQEQAERLLKSFGKRKDSSYQEEPEWIVNSEAIRQ